MKSYCAGFVELNRNDNSRVKSPTIEYREFKKINELKYKLLLEKQRNYILPTKDASRLESNPALYSLLSPMERILNYKQFPYNDSYKNLTETLDVETILSSHEFKKRSIFSNSKN